MNRRSALAIVSVAVVVIVLVTLQWSKSRPSAADREESARREEANRKDIALVVEKHGTASKAKLDALEAVARDAKAAPPLEARQPVAALAAIGAAGRLEGGLLVVSVGWDDATTTTPSPVGIDDEWLKGLDNGLRNGFPPGRSPTALDAELGQLTGLRYVAMARVRLYDRPKVTPIGREWQYTGGRAAGDVLVYDLETKARVGGFPFEITQRGTAFVRGKSTAAKETELEKDFRSEARSRFIEELGAFIGGKPGGRDR